MVNSVKPYSLRASVRIRALVSFFRTRYCPDASSSSRRDNSTHRAAILLRHADPGELFLASLLRHHVRIRSRSYDSVFPRHHSRFLSRSREKKSHKKRKFSSTSSPSSHRFPSLLLEKEKGNGTCLKKKHISLRSFNMTSV